MKEGLMPGPRVGWFFILLVGTPSLLWAAMSSSDYTDIGMACYRAGQYVKAADYLKRAVEVDPQNWQAYEDLGDSNMKLGDNPDALDAYEQSLKAHPGNPTLQTLVDHLSGLDSSRDPTPNAGPPASCPTPIVVHTDNATLMSHSKFWTRGEIGYNHWANTVMVDSAKTFNSGQFNPGKAIAGSVSYTGGASAGTDNLQWGAEAGYMLNPYLGISIGVQLITLNAGGYSANVGYDTGDSEQLSLQENLLPITANLYLFLPDPLGRLFISGGFGYYVADVDVDQTTTTNNFFGTDNGNTGTGSNQWTGFMQSANIGFQVGAGHDFALTDKIGISLYARAYYVQITNFKGTLTDSNGATQHYGLASSASSPTVIDADLTQFINGAEKYAMVDFTGYDIGAAVVFYNF
jgi:tetratricopeptide (TPR) repeat protein